MIRRLCIFGVGLIGGSLARALRAANACEEIVGCSRRPEHLREALELGVIDRMETDPVLAVAGADMVVVCVPLGAIGAVFKTIAGHLADDAVLTDAGSAKMCVVRAAEQAFGHIPPCLVPAHPVAGTERSGVSASFASLYEGRRSIITPTPVSDPEAVRRVRAMWEAAGAQVVEMDATRHDEILAATSHLPHLLAYNLVDVLGRMEERQEMFRYAAGGFRDFTRIASSDPTMWHDICLANGDAILMAIEAFREGLADLECAVREQDGKTLMDAFARSKAIRDRFTEQNQP